MKTATTKATRQAFEIEDLFKSIDGYTLGEYWNGWSMPYFTKDGADKIMEVLNADKSQQNAKWIGETIHLLEEGYDDGPVIINPETIETEDGPKVLYAIGAGYWTWVDVTEAIHN